MNQHLLATRRRIVVAAACAASLPGASAADPVGFYVGGGGGVTNYNIDYGAAGDPYSFDASNLWQTNLSFGAGATWNIDRRWPLRADRDRYQNIGPTFAPLAAPQGEYQSVGAALPD